MQIDSDGSQEQLQAFEQPCYTKNRISNSCILQRRATMVSNVNKYLNELLGQQPTRGKVEALVVAQAQARLQGDCQPHSTISLLTRLIQRCEELGVSWHGGPAKAVSSGTTRNPARKSKRAPLSGQSLHPHKQVCVASMCQTRNQNSFSLPTPAMLNMFFFHLLFGPGRSGHRSAEADASDAAAERVWQCLDPPGGRPPNGMLQAQTLPCFRRDKVRTVTASDFIAGVDINVPAGLLNDFIQEGWGWCEAAACLWWWLQPSAVGLTGAKAVDLFDSFDLSASAACEPIFGNVVNHFLPANRQAALLEWQV